MKKTIVAAAVAAVVAAPAAFADVSISGQINQEFFDAGGDLQSDSNVDLVFKGSEDLGNGMKASFTIHHFYDDASFNNADQSIGLSGDFGSITVGRFEPYTENQVVALASGTAGDNISVETNLGNQTRTEGGIRYVSPSMSGFKVGLEGFAEENSAGDDFATTTIFAEYSNGPLLVRVANEETKSDAVTAVAHDATATGAAGTLAAAAVNNEILTAAVQYKMGDTQFRVVHSDLDGGDDEQFYGVTHKMGANTIALSMINSDAATDGDYAVSFAHAMSKQTSVYVAHDSDDSNSAADVTLVGIQHKF